MAKRGFLDGYKTYDTSCGFGDVKQWKDAFRQRMSKEEANEIMKKSSETPLTILGVSADSSLQEIKSAYRKKLMEWHPDKNQHRLREAEEMTKKIIAAFVNLTS